jgi:hypothetical protein
VIVTDAVAFCPEQTAFVPQAAEFGVIVKPLSNGAGLTTTDADTVVPAESCTVTVTLVAVPTCAGFRTMVLDDDARLTGRTAASLENARYGGTPPEIVNVAGVPAYAVRVAGNTVSAAGAAGPGTYGLFGAPLPPPQADSASTPAVRSKPTRGRSQAADRRFSVMVDSLMMLS